MPDGQFGITFKGESIQRSPSAAIEGVVPVVAKTKKGS